MPWRDVGVCVDHETAGAFDDVTSACGRDDMLGVTEYVMPWRDVGECVDHAAAGAFDDVTAACGRDVKLGVTAKFLRDGRVVQFVGVREGVSGNEKSNNVSTFIFTLGANCGVWAVERWLRDGRYVTGVSQGDAFIAIIRVPRSSTNITY